MTEKKRGRDAAHRRAALAAARAEQRRRQQRFRLTILGLIALVAVIALLVTIFPGDGDDDTEDVEAFGDDTETTIEEDATTSTTVDEGPFEYGTGECPPAEKPATPPESFSDAPQQCIEDDVDYGATIETSEGTFTIDLLEEDAPGTVNNFVVLARWGWFDGVTFHRVVPQFVNQTGDRTGNPPGTGDPGYEIADELPGSLDDYVPGAVAMANSGPDTNGSQWFTCIDCSVLPTPAYSLFGQVVEGMDVVEAINALGQGDGPPSREVTITAVTITES